MDGLIDGRLRGWVIHASRPRDRVVVRFGMDKRLPSQAIADQYRADVQRAGLSEHGYCGFSLRLDALEQQGATRLHLKLSPAHRLQIIDTAPRSIASRPRALAHAIDRGNGCVSGFALDLDDPSRRVRLELVEHDGSRREVVACRFDARARPTPEHDGFHGFRLPCGQGAARLTDVASGLLVAAWAR